MKKKCPVCGDEHECRRETCRECGGHGRFVHSWTTTGVGEHNIGVSGVCNRCGGTGYEPEEKK
jgi:DnaJ-class molecular chaperone